MTDEQMPPRERIGGNQPPLADRLSIDHADILADLEAIVRRANEAPKKVLGDADKANVGKIVVDARALRKRADEKRVEEKKPFLEATRTIDGFFNAPIIERLERIEGAMNSRATLYDNEVRAQAVAAAEAEAAKARKAADAKREAAEKAEAEGRDRAAANARQAANNLDAKASSAAARAAEPVKELTRMKDAATGVGSSQKSRWAGRIIDIQKVDLEALRPFLAVADVQKAINLFVRANKNLRPLAGVEIFDDAKTTFRG